MATLFQKQAPQMEVSPEQEVHRQKEAQALFQRLQKMLLEGEMPAFDILSEALTNFEGLTSHTALQTQDLETRKTLEDISALLLSARQMARNKGISDRLQRIGEETQKALKSFKPGVPGAGDLLSFMNTWRPVFYLLLSSRDFRIMILDSIRIAKRVIYSYTDSISDETEQKFIEGESAQQISESIKQQVQEKPTPEMTDEEWDRIQIDLQRVLIQLAREPNFRDGIEKIFNLLDMFQTTLMQEVPTATGLPVPKDIHVQRIVGETEELVSCFSGRDTLEQFKFRLGNLVRKARTHEDFHTYLIELKIFLLKTKSEEEVRTEEFKEKSKKLAHRGRELMRQFKDNDDLRPFLDSANLLIDNIKKDEFLRIMRHQAGIVQSDLSYVDTEGKLQLDTDMLTKLQKVLLPVLVDALKYIPVPRIQL